MKNNDFPSFRKNLGRLIQSIRKKRGITQEELGSLIGLDRVSIGYIEQGIRTPKLKTLFLIAKALRIDLKNLL